MDEQPPRKLVGVYDRPPEADRRRRWHWWIIAIVLALIGLYLLFFPSIGIALRDAVAGLG